MAQVFGGYLRRSNLMYVYVWNGSGMIESSAGLDYFGALDKDSIELDCLNHSAELDCFEIQIKTRHG